MQGLWVCHQEMRFPLTQAVPLTVPMRSMSIFKG